MFKVVKLVAENIKKLKAVVIEPTFDNVVKITGPNEQGKTTVLDAIWYAIGGKDALDDDPIRRGEKSAKVELDLGEYTIIRTFTEKGSYLHIKSAPGVEPFNGTAQKFCDQLFSKYTFNPLNFMKAKKADRMDLLLKIVNIQVAHGKLQEITGLEVKPGKNFIEDINNTYQRVYDLRKEKNGWLNQAKKVFESLPVIPECKPVVLTDLVKERDQILKHNENNEKIREDLKKQQEKIKNLEEQGVVAEADIKSIELQIAELQKKLEQKKKDLSVKAQEIKQEIVKEDELQRKVESLEDLPTFDIDAKIESADEQNRQYQKYQERIKAKESLESLQKESDELTNKLEKIKEYKGELLKSAPFPVEGLGFSADGVTYKGLPFEQASKAEQIQISMAIAIAMNPKLRVVRIDDGSLLDKSHMEIIERMAAENDFQVWIEIVDTSGQVGIYIEDGQIVEKKLVN